MKTQDTIGNEALASSQEATRAVSPEQNLFSKGEQRVLAAEKFVSDTKDRIVSSVKRVGRSILSRLVGGARAAAVGIASTPELIAAGGNAVVDKYESARDTVESAVNKVDQKLEAGFGAGWNFLQTKKEQVIAIKNQGVELAKDAKFAVQTKTTEAIGQARASAARAYEGTVNYGRESVASAKERVLQCRDVCRDKLNALRLARLQRELDSARTAEEAALDRAEEQANRRIRVMAAIDALNGAGGLQLEQAA